MFDENNMFENIFSAINVCPKLGDAMFDEDDIFFSPGFDEKIYYDNSKLPTYDGYIDKSGFREVMTCMLLRVMITMKLVIMILIFNWIMRHMIVILLNSFMMLLKIIMREEHMLVGIAIISSFLSMCLKF